MSIVFQLTLLGLVLYSLVLVVAVPVFYGSPADWGRDKNIILIGGLVWVGWVVAVAILNFVR